MAFTTPPTFTAGAVLTAAQLNILGDDLSYLYLMSQQTSFTGVRVMRNTNQSINDSTDTLVSFNVESMDSGGWYPGTGTTITVPAGAIPSGSTQIAIACHMYVAFAANATGVRNASAYHNGAAFLSNKYSAASADTTDLVGSMEREAVATDTFELNVKQTSGGALNMTQAVFSIYRVGVVA